MLASYLEEKMDTHSVHCKDKMTERTWVGPSDYSLVGDSDSPLEDSKVVVLAV